MTKVINLRRRQGINYKPITNNNSSKKFKINNTEITKLLLVLISLLSLLVGCFIYKNSNLNVVPEMCSSFITDLQNKNFFQLFLFLVKQDLIYFIICFFVGTSIIGIPFTFIPISIKCIFIGCLSSFMYCQYSLKGILFSLVLLYPLFTITTTSLIYSANESIYMSKHIFNTMTNKNTADSISIRLYLIRYAFLVGINLVCIAVNSFLIMLLYDRLIWFVLIDFDLRKRIWFRCFFELFINNMSVYFCCT